ncbi:haloacid dehalogenase [Catellatospora methionotrophica]|uniref:Haloacid dehalogenase n=1 Tax=Catellatospora methionotrophica TaxID=121620 RepID=A0A8J3LMQ7_9ACTN|nr:haloacid dehalogenase [Catellatospora methionotrophica]
MLVLWDLDHTLLETGGVDREIWFALCAQLLGLPVAPAEVVPGSTAPQLLRAILVQRGATPDEADRLLPDALRLELEFLTARRDELRRRGRAMPGALAAIAVLAGRPDVLQSVLTGNQRPGAEAKLGAYALLGSLDLDIGAYGSDDSHRPALVEVARKRAEAAQPLPISAEQIVLIGDSLLDIDAAHRNGARVVAVATGEITAEQLRAAGADAVLDDLTDTGAFLAAVLGR